ncbi:hypothetical protein [Mycobacterium sp. MS1601]|uniref:hypothetical protein n=1 Tax=Mycobacterium sp. MS1601 TaxID=1936029 RepID=UPI0012F84B21|nr:hypothetical protein [Mycobacterium sp. MS1601]
MANTTPEPLSTPDGVAIDRIAAASDMLLFGDPGLALFGGTGRSSDSLYHGRHRVAE